MSGPNIEQAQTQLQNAIADVLHAQGQMLIKWITLIEDVDADGQRGLWLVSNDGATAWDNLGMLTYATQQEQARATTHFGHEHD
jgi:hypothetical protein